MLAEFCKVLSKEALDWLSEKWDLCPLLTKQAENPDSLSPRKILSSGLMETRDVGAGGHVLEIDFTKMPFMDGWVASDCVGFPDDWSAVFDGNVLSINID